MATVAQDIGAGETHTTIASWESNLDNATDYSSGDDAEGNCKDETFTETVVVNGGGTIGLIDVVLQGKSGARHDGTHSTGAEIVGRVDLASEDTLLQWMVVGNVTESSNNNMYGVRSSDPDSTGFGCRIRHNIIHDISGRKVEGGVLEGDGSVDIIRNVIFDMDTTGGGSRGCQGIGLNSGDRDARIEGNTLFDCATNGSGTLDIVEWRDAVGHTVYNNVACANGNGEACFNDSSVDTGAGDTNASTDATAPGATNFRSILLADQFVSTTTGFEDLTVQDADADIVDVGTDRTTTVPNGNIDIVAFDIHADGGSWDIGASEFQAAVAGSLVYARPPTHLLVR